MSEKEEKTLGPFDIVNAITVGLKDVKEDEQFKKAYVPFIINRHFSYFSDTILLANEMNRLSTLDNDMQFDYYINTIKPRKRFAKWAKREVLQDIDFIKKHYNYSNAKARSALTRLTKEQIATLRNMYGEVLNE